MKNIKNKLIALGVSALMVVAYSPVVSSAKTTGTSSYDAVTQATSGSGSDSSKDDEKDATLTVNAVTTSDKKITGTGLKGAKVKAYVKGDKIGSEKVKSDGSYTIKIDKQKKGTVITVKMSKDGYKTQTKEITVTDSYDGSTGASKDDEKEATLTVNPVTKSDKKITGTGLKGAKVKAYVKGDKIGSEKVKSDGSYTIKIDKQKKGTVIIVKMSKDGYKTQTKEIKVTDSYDGSTGASK